MPYAVCFCRLLCFPRTLVPFQGLLTSGLTCGLALRDTERENTDPPGFMTLVRGIIGAGKQCYE